MSLPGSNPSSMATASNRPCFSGFAPSMGISFAAAMALAADSPAFAKTVASISPAPSGYADIVGPDVVAYLDAVAATDSPSPTAEFDDHFFVQKSGEPFPKFDKAP